MTTAWRVVAGGLAALAVASCTPPPGKVAPPRATVRLVVPTGTQSTTRSFHVDAMVTAPRTHGVSGWLAVTMSGLVLDPTVQSRSAAGGWSAPLNGRGASIGHFTVRAGQTRRIEMRVGTGAHPPSRHGGDERGTLPVRPRVVHLSATFGSVRASADVRVAGVGIARVPAHLGCVLEKPPYSCELHLVLVNHSHRAAPTGLHVAVQQKPCASGSECFVYDEWKVRTARLGWVTPHGDPTLADFVARLGMLPPGRTPITVLITRTKPGGRWAGNLSMWPMSTASSAEFYRSCVYAATAGTRDLLNSDICW